MPDVACVSVWLLLGAVLNPSSFLAFASGVVVMYGFVVSRLEHVYKLTLQLEVQLLEFVEAKLGKNVMLALKNSADKVKQGQAPSVDEVRRGIANAPAPPPLYTTLPRGCVSRPSVMGAASPELTPRLREPPWLCTASSRLRPVLCSRTRRLPRWVSQWGSTSLTSRSWLVASSKPSSAWRCGSTWTRTSLPR